MLDLCLFCSFFATFRPPKAGPFCHFAFISVNKKDSFAHLSTNFFTLAGGPRRPVPWRPRRAARRGPRGSLGREQRDPRGPGTWEDSIGFLGYSGFRVDGTD